MNDFPLYKKYPELQVLCPRVPLLKKKTSVRKMEKMENLLGFGFHKSELWLKNDGETHSVFGGNKIRKLEFLLGGAPSNVNHLVTLGATGSNHCVATSVVAQQLNLKCSVYLKAQTGADYVTENLKHHSELKTRIWRDEDLKTHKLFPSLEDLEFLVDDVEKTLWIPTGGSHPKSHWAYVNAALELNEQVEAGLCPLPEKIYIACGTSGSVVGLMAGFKMLGLDIQVIAVRVVPEFLLNDKSLLKALLKFNKELLRVGLPFLQWDKSEMNIQNTAFGEGYAEPTKASEKWSQIVGEQEGLLQEWTYTGKVWDAIVQDLEAGTLEGQKVFFWNTFHM